MTNMRASTAFFARLAFIFSYGLPLATWAAPCSSPAASIVPGHEGLDAGLSDAKKANTTTGAYAWFEGWLGIEALSNVTLSKYDALIYSFVIPTADIKLDLLEQEDDIITFVDTVKAANVSAWASIGGYTGSRFFSTAVGNEANRTAFVTTVLDFAREYELDGLDFDWEYPGSENGMSCNLVDEHDTDNFLLFLQALRKDDLGANLTITAAVATSPFENASEGNIAAFAEVLDHIAIMNYDNYGDWTETTGPNAPMDNSCSESQEGSSAIAAVKAWTEAGFPASQIVLGVPSYGHKYSVVPDMALTAQDDDDDTINFYSDFSKMGTSGKKDVCRVDIPLDPNVDFTMLVQANYLQVDGSANSDASTYHYAFDNCSQTPFIYDEDKGLLISFDDAKSFTVKGEFIQDQGLKGFAMWHVNGDHDDVLVNAISVGMGRTNGTEIEELMKRDLSYAL